MNIARSKTPPDPAAPQPRAVTREEPTAAAPTPQRPRTPTPASIGRTPTRATPAGGTPIIAATAPAPAANPEAAAAAERARRHLAADEHDQALREASAALRLAPESFDYHALHAWAAFCASRDKAAAADTARKILEKASHRAAATIEARFLLGRLERIVGREREALRHFRAVLEHDPGHTAAAAELRELEAQLEAFARR